MLSRSEVDSHQRKPLVILGFGMTGFETVIFEKRDGVAWITLNRPDVLNALNLQMRDELWSLLEACRADPEVGVIVFRGAGDRAFSAGADLTEFGTAPSYVEARRARRERDLWGVMAAYEKPLIAAVHGYALGAGCELSLLCDLRIASEDARFGLPEVALGYIPSAGGTQTLPREIGPARALDLILGGEPVDARTALAWGIVQWVAPNDDLDATAAAVAARVLARDQAAVNTTKQMVRRGLDLRLDEGLRLEARLGAISTR
jgi:enoyl-CoA hydratase/carnithine racemase